MGDRTYLICGILSRGNHDCRCPTAIISYRGRHPWRLLRVISTGRENSDGQPQCLIGEMTTKQCQISTMTRLLFATCTWSCPLSLYSPYHGGYIIYEWMEQGYSTTVLPLLRSSNWLSKRKIKILGIPCYTPHPKHLTENPSHFTARYTHRFILLNVASLFLSNRLCQCGGNHVTMAYECPGYRISPINC